MPSYNRQGAVRWYKHAISGNFDQRSTVKKYDEGP